MLRSDRSVQRRTANGYHGSSPGSEYSVVSRPSLTSDHLAAHSYNGDYYSYKGGNSPGGNLLGLRQPLNSGGPRPRFQLITMSDAEKLEEKDKVMEQLRERPLTFKFGQEALSQDALQTIQQAADVLQDYPEIDIVIEGLAGGDEQPEEAMKLTQARLEACRVELEQLGVINKIKAVARGAKSRGDPGIVRLRPSKTAKLLDPQQRLDAILSARGFDFAPKTAEMSERGHKTVAAMARVLKETLDKKIIFTLPRRSSTIAIKRAEVIANSVKRLVAGPVVSVQVATGDQSRATVVIENLDSGPDGRSDLRTLQKQLDALLDERPLAFKRGEQELVPDAAPILEQCAKVLRKAHDTTCLVEVYGGLSSSRPSELQALGRLVVNALRREGITQIPLHARGVSGVNPNVAAATTAPSVALTFDDEAELEEEPLEAGDHEMLGCWAASPQGVEVEEVGPNTQDQGEFFFCCVSNDMEDAQVVTKDIVPSPKPFQAADGSTYLGGWRDGERLGQGVQEWPNGDRYEGQFFADRAEGKGTFWYSNGDFYKGEWEDDGAHGHGTYSRADGSTYNGQFVRDLQDGQGVEVWPDGKQYVGEYVNGVKHGEGTLTWKDGSKYVGSFYNDVIHGAGVHGWGRDGHRYEGQFNMGQMSGNGVFVSEEGSEYAGQFAAGRKHGRGTLKGTDGGAFTGSWSQGRQHGSGRLTEAGGGSRDEEWHEGKLMNPRPAK